MANTKADAGQRLLIYRELSQYKKGTPAFARAVRELKDSLETVSLATIYRIFNEERKLRGVSGQ